MIKIQVITSSPTEIVRIREILSEDKPRGFTIDAMTSLEQVSKMNWNKVYDLRIVSEEFIQHAFMPSLSRICKEWPFTPMVIMTDATHDCPTLPESLSKRPIYFIDRTHVNASLLKRIIDSTLALGNAQREVQLSVARYRRVEKSLLESKQELDIRNQIANVFLTIPDEQIYGEVLDIILEVFRSPFGYFAYIDENGDLTVPTLTRTAWDKCEMSGKDIIFPRASLTGTIARSLDNCETIMMDSPADVPSGHVPINRLLMVPIVHQEAVIGQIALANKPVRYTKGDKTALERIAEYVAPILSARLAREVQGRERQRAEGSRDLLQAAIDQSAESVVITDASGKILYLNPAFEQIEGYSREEALGKDYLSLLGHQEAQQYFRSALAHPESHEAWHSKGERTRKDGSRYVAETTIFPVRDSNGLIVNFVSLSRDVSHEADLEGRLLQAKKMEALGTLAGGIAHDFNNILYSIIGFTELAMDDIPNEARPRRELEEVIRAGKRGRELVEQILTFSLRKEPVLRSISVQPIIHEVLKLLRRLIQENIEIQTDLDPNCPNVCGDPTQIYQMTMNLCANAYHAMRGTGGVLRVVMERAERLPEEAAVSRKIPTRGYARLRFEDTGCGMDEAVRERIFEPYYTTKKPGEGVGLGLATVHGIVEAHRGVITVESVLGQGTTFEVYLPVFADCVSEMDSERPGISKVLGKPLAAKGLATAVRMTLDGPDDKEA